MASDVILALVGVAMVVTVALDALLTTLHPGLDGPVTQLANRTSWALMHAVSRATRRPGVLGWSGPIAMMLNLGLWLLGLVVGYALVYLPFLDRFGGDWQPHSFVDALYISGVALTTVGFGDVVATTGGFRLVTVTEAASGLAAFTAAIAYLLTVYPLFISLRDSARRISDRGLLEPRTVTTELLAGGDVLARLHEVLVRSHGTVQSFPVLYYFNPTDRDASIYTLMRAGFTVSLIARHGIADERLPAPESHVRAVERALSRIVTSYQHRSPGRRGAGDQTSAEDADAALAHLRALVHDVDPHAVATGDDRDRAYAAARADADGFLAMVARDRGYDHDPLLLDVR